MRRIIVAGLLAVGITLGVAGTAEAYRLPPGAHYCTVQWDQYGRQYIICF